MARGTLRIYLGAAPGVGKTYAMLGELRRRNERGADGVVGVVETHGRRRTAEQLAGLEVVPRRNVEYRGTTLTELDVEAVIARAPDVVAVDEYAHTNAPGSPNEKRWQDVEQILDAGIDVITTVNVQHLESLNDVVAEITGVQQQETVPDRVVRAADQIELVDMSPEALRRRMAHGNIYPAERATAALANFFRPGNLGALRELALLWVADRVEEHLAEYLEQHGVASNWETRERVVVGLSGSPTADGVIRRAARIARRVGGELIGVHVGSADGRVVSDRDRLDAQQELVRSLGGTVREVVGDDAVVTLIEVARAEHATQIVIGATRESRWREVARGSFVARLSRLADGIDVHVVGDVPRSVPRRPHGADPRPTTGTRRLAVAWALLAAGLPLLTVLLVAVRDELELTSVMLLFLGFVVVVAVLGGRAVALAGGVAGSLLINFFFVEPRHTLSVGSVDDVVALVLFTVVAIVVGVLVDRIATQAASAQRSRSEAELLVRAAAVMAGDPDPAGALLGIIVGSLQFGGAGLVRMQHGTAETIAEAGALAEPSHEIGLRAGRDGAERALVVCGRPLTTDDRRILQAVGEQLVIALDGQSARHEARRSQELAAIDKARTALLRAVSHDLRTPLATIKAMASGLRDPSVPWEPEHVREAHVVIDQEADRLNQLIGNLLDASRLETGSLAVSIAPTSVPDVVAAAVRSLSGSTERVEVRCDDVPLVLADRSLLERAIANLIDNARRFSPDDAPITITAERVGDDVHVRVVDRGPGIPIERREHVTAPFQRLDDHGGDGVGLGMSIVDGFVRSMGGRVVLDDTPGGGLTVTIVLLVVVPVGVSADGGVS